LQSREFLFSRSNGFWWAGAKLFFLKAKEAIEKSMRIQAGQGQQRSIRRAKKLNR
jgi:hypothetical protein